MKKIVILLLVLFLIFNPVMIYAKSGCCSHHGGVAGCSGVKQLCNDGTLSPTCYCETTTVSYKDYYGSNYAVNSAASYNSFNSDEHEVNPEEIYLVLAVIAGIAIAKASKD